MTPASVLFVTNGHGEIAIADRIAHELDPDIRADHLALVGDTRHGVARMHDVGPRRAMPSGGLVAMGNVRNIARDIAGGLLVHTLTQLRFLRRMRGKYDVAVAVGDVFALLMAQRAGARRTIFTGTAKSVFVAPYGTMEERAIRRADAVFVRDEPTASRLRARGIPAQAANVIVDLHEDRTHAMQRDFDPAIALFPGSREAAYADAVQLCGIVRLLARERPQAGATLSVAPSLDATRMARALAADEWTVSNNADPLAPFDLKHGGRTIVTAWRGTIGAMLRGATIVLGQAGTANEAAAAAGIPVVAYERRARPAWYRKRQIALLGDALLLVRGTRAQAAAQVSALLNDPQRRAAMGDEGRRRMGQPGGAVAIAREIERLCE